MRRLSAAQMLDVWERGAPLPWVRRALVLLTAVCPEMDENTLARLPIAARDARLVGLREAMFGSRFECLVRCPRCGERLEISLSMTDVRRAFEGKAGEAASTRQVRMDGYEVTYRLLNSHDFVAHDALAQGGNGIQQLVETCVLDARADDRSVALDALPSAIVEAVAQGLVDAEAQAGIQLGMTCPTCTHGWESTFDIVTYLWSEIDAWARSILADVHTLASAYGWRETDILAMTASRRRIYLNLVGGNSHA